jgi:hypothetical protein
MRHQTVAEITPSSSVATQPDGPQYVEEKSVCGHIRLAQNRSGPRMGMMHHRYALVLRSVQAGISLRQVCLDRLYPEDRMVGVTWRQE